MIKIKASLLEHLISLEKTLMQDDVRGDSLRLGELLDDDFIEISVDGRQFDKSNVLGRLPKEQAKGRKPRFHNQDFSARMLGETVAQLSYKAALQRIKGGPWHYSVRMSVWRQNEQQQWQIVYHQGSPCEPFVMNQS